MRMVRFILSLLSVPCFVVAALFTGAGLLQESLEFRILVENVWSVCDAWAFYGISLVLSWFMFRNWWAFHVVRKSAERRARAVKAVNVMNDWLTSVCSSELIPSLEAEMLATTADGSPIQDTERERRTVVWLLEHAVSIGRQSSALSGKSKRFAEKALEIAIGGGKHWHTLAKFPVTIKPLVVDRIHSMSRLYGKEPGFAEFVTVMFAGPESLNDEGRGDTDFEVAGVSTDGKR